MHKMIHLLARHHNEKYLKYITEFLPNLKVLKRELNKLPVSHVGWKY
ncbi:MAG: DUF45 domain-containing protein [Saprospiraceae bacterium]|uniref:DUF45 domain-containing protein n=1 Tax=Candidatus Defluviibacterium haderslevense TaxID=2981993 RepID=A0A9D7S649_9BACT|nr:DUF45 domain-containing protein [Candidatus Defluviibacterium haderslevense]